MHGQPARETGHERQHTEEVFKALFSISNAVNTTVELKKV
ncbi:MAG: hypothetical protein [Olavius algarvensis Delta 4 endosymbiont]|nr:MAG: hypothetical protein [Olavius algarvensis Delta 4 endosymbiont]